MGLSLKRVEDEAYAEVDWRAGGGIEDDSDETWADADDFNGLKSLVPVHDILTGS